MKEGRHSSPFPTLFAGATLQVFSDESPPFSPVFGHQLSDGFVFLREINGKSDEHKQDDDRRRLTNKTLPELHNSKLTDWRPYSVNAKIEETDLTRI